MADVIGLVASVISVASSGVKLSRTLHDYGSAVQGYEKRLKGLDKDIYLTSGIISELGTLLNDLRVQSLVSERSIELAREIVAEFEGMFETIEDIIAGTRADSMGGKVEDLLPGIQDQAATIKSGSLEGEPAASPRRHNPRFPDID